MSTAAKARPPRPILSGWCSHDATPASHAHCVGAYGGHPCRCDCHTIPEPPPVIVAHCFLGCGHAEYGTGPQAVHDAMETHYATRHALVIAAIAGQVVP